MSSGDPGAKTDFQCGYVALVGRPNVGKSTLMNCILGQKLSIVTAKPQTTRQRIAGIKTTEQGQVIYIDTPGIHLAARRALNRYMNRIAQAAFQDVDLILFLIEAGRWTRQDEHVARSLERVDAPVVLVMNKVDLVPDKARLLRFVSEESRHWKGLSRIARWRSQNCHKWRSMSRRISTPSSRRCWPRTRTTDTPMPANCWSI